MRQGAPPRHGSLLYRTHVYDRTCGIASPPVHALPVLFLGSFRILPPSPGRHTQDFWTFRSTIWLLRQLGQKSYCEQPRGNHVLQPALAARGQHSGPSMAGACVSSDPNAIEPASTRGNVCVFCVCGVPSTSEWITCCFTVCTVGVAHVCPCTCTNLCPVYVNDGVHTSSVCVSPLHTYTTFQLPCKLR